MNHRRLVAAINKHIYNYDPGMADEFRKAHARLALAEATYTEAELNEPIAYTPSQILKRDSAQRKRERKRACPTTTSTPKVM